MLHLFYLPTYWLYGPGYTDVLHDKNSAESVSCFAVFDNDTIPLTFLETLGVERGFAFHHSCSRLLQDVLRPASISLQRLLDVCRSHPVLPHGHAPSWGHNYGGAAIVDKDQSFPWEEAQQYVAHDFTGPHMLFSEDPYHVPGVDRLITADSQQPSPMFT